MVAEEIVVTLSGGAPWGFRLQGGAEHKKPLQVAKVRKRSKACRAGLREADELMSINDKLCGGLSHAQAMNLIDGGSGTLHIRVKRAPSSFQSVVLLTRSPSPRIDKEHRSAGREVRRGAHTSPTSKDSAPRRESVTSPPDSEAYYGETDSDADTVNERQRRLKRRSPSGSPAKMGGRSSPEETSEMSGYESAPDAQADSSPPQQSCLSGVPRREIIYQPPHSQNSPENSYSSMDDQSPVDGPVLKEMDTGFQEPPSMFPQDWAKEAFPLASRSQLVPMIGPLDNPVDEELTVTYMDKAKQAKLHRGESVQEKQVKEARSKCRSIAALLTDAPNPHSKGVLMFKKRRQRAKRYTLTCFGTVEDLQGQDGTTDENEEGIFPTSESELDEDGFTSAPESAWDSDHFDILERKTATAGFGDPESPGLNDASGKGAQLFEQQRRRAEEHAAEASLVVMYTEACPHQVSSLVASDVPALPAIYTTVSMPAPLAEPTPAAPGSRSMMNGDCTVVSQASLLMSPPPVNGGPLGSVPNRTAQPFAAGIVSHRTATTPVVFRPSVPKKSPPQPTAAAQDTPLPFSPPPAEVKRAISTTSLYIPPKSVPRNAPPYMLSPPSSVAAALVYPFTSSPALSAPLTSVPSFDPVPQASSFSPPLMQASSVYLPPAQVIPFSPPPVQVTPLLPPTAHATSVYLPLTQNMPLSPPPAQPMPFSPPPAQPMPFSPPPAQPMPFSPPPVQKMPFYPPPAQPMPFSPPPVQKMPFSPPPAQPMPISPPPVQKMPFSPPPAQPMPVSPPPVQKMPFSPPPAQPMPVSPPPVQKMPFSPPPAQPMPFSPPPVQKMPFSPPPAQPMPVSPPPVQKMPFSPPPAQPMPISPPPVQKMPFSPPPAQPMPISPPPVQKMPFSPPPAQPMPISPPSVQPSPFSPALAQPSPFSPPSVQPSPFSPPSAQSTQFSPAPAQPMPFSPLPAQPTPLSPPPAQTVPPLSPAAQPTPVPQPPMTASTLSPHANNTPSLETLEETTPLSPLPVHTTSYYLPQAQATPVSTHSAYSTPFPAPPVQAPSLILAAAETPAIPPPPVPSTTRATPVSATHFPSSATSVSHLSPHIFSPPPQQPSATAVPLPPTPKVSFSPFVTVAATTPSPPVSAAPATPPISIKGCATTTSTEALTSREQRISVPAARTGILQDARRRGSKKPMFSACEEKKQNSPNPELLSLVQNLDEKPRAGTEPGFESGPEEDSLNLGAEACNFMQAHKSRLPPPVAPKPHAAHNGPQIPQMGGKGAELFARRQSRMDRYVVDRTAPSSKPMSPADPRLPSPTPSLPNHWKYSPNIRAPPPIGYNPLLSPSCPPGAQRSGKTSQAVKVTKKTDVQKQALKPLDVMARQPYQLNSAMFTYGGGESLAPAHQQSQNISLTTPKQIPVKAARVYNIKRFSTPTPMSAPATLSPAVIAPRSATTLGEPLRCFDVVSPPPTSPSPPPVPTGRLPELPKIYSAPVPNPTQSPAVGLTYAPLQSARQWVKSAPELSPQSSAVSGSSQSVRVPRPRFCTSSMGLQPKVWRPGSVLY